MAAEVIKAFFPKCVELHNYPAANSTPKKIENWNTLLSLIMIFHVLILFTFCIYYRQSIKKALTAFSIC